MNGNTVEELLAIVPSDSQIEDHSLTISAQATLSQSDGDTPIGRVLAPVHSTKSSNPPRPQSSSAYSMDDFPMDATEVDSQIEIHFDITGKSTSEGSLNDIRSCFRSRLTS